MKLALVAGLVALALCACQTSSDPFCRTHNAADAAPSVGAYHAMSTDERRAAQRRFDEAARRCGWEP